jgi:hypothetical protein
MTRSGARTRQIGTFEILEFLPGPGTGFLHKKRVPGGLLSAPLPLDIASCMLAVRGAL